MTPEEWRARGAWVDVPEGRVFTIDLGPREGVPIFVLHGFPSSSWDFDEAAALVAKRQRVVLFDFLGFGWSDKPEDFGYSLFQQADIALAVAKHAGITRAHLWAHDMGTSVTTELLARRERGLLPLAIESVCLMNGSVHIEMANLTPGQRLLRSRAGDAFAAFAGRRIFGAQMKRIFSHRPSEETLDGMWRLMAHADGNRRLARTIHYVDERYRFGKRWIGALERLDLPVLIAWGARDPVARMSIGETLAREIRNARLVRWDDLGHYPQMEDPSRVAEAVTAFFRPDLRRE
jgi:pimeloyl-ACP methyl ester carboxylesterase